MQMLSVLRRDLELFWKSNNNTKDLMTWNYCVKGKCKLTDYKINAKNDYKASDFIKIKCVKIKSVDK